MIGLLLWLTAFAAGYAAADAMTSAQFAEYTATVEMAVRALTTGTIKWQAVISALLYHGLTFGIMLLGTFFSFITPVGMLFYFAVPIPFGAAAAFLFSVGNEAVLCAVLCVLLPCVLYSLPYAIAWSAMIGGGKKALHGQGSGKEIVTILKAGLLLPAACAVHAAAVPWAFSCLASLFW